jgi:hypothetical protein
MSTTPIRSRECNRGMMLAEHDAFIKAVSTSRSRGCASLHHALAAAVIIADEHQ